MKSIKYFTLKFKNDEATGDYLKLFDEREKWLWKLSYENTVCHEIQHMAMNIFIEPSSPNISDIEVKSMASTESIQMPQILHLPSSGYRKDD